MAQKTMTQEIWWDGERHTKQELIERKGEKSANDLLEMADEAYRYKNWDTFIWTNPHIVIKTVYK